MGRYRNPGSSVRVVPVGHGVVAINPGHVAELPDAAVADTVALGKLVRVDAPAVAAHVAEAEAAPVIADSAPELVDDEPGPVAAVVVEPEPAPVLSRSERKRLAREGRGNS